MKTPHAALLLFTALLISACGKKDDGTLVFSGTMDATTVRVSAQTPGQIVSLSCAEGDSVSGGAVLAVLDTDKLGYQLDQGTAAVQELENQLRSATAQRDAARIQCDNLRQKHERFVSLLQSNGVTRQAVDDLRAQLDAAEQQLRSAEAQLSALRDKRKQVEAGMNITRRQVRDATITAPIAGTVLVRYAEAGELLGVGGPLCEIADLSVLWTKIYVEAPDLPDVQLGQPALVELDGGGQKLEGHVSWISDKSEFTPKTILTAETRSTLVYPVKVTVKNPDGVLKIGMPVTVRLKKEG